MALKDIAQLRRDEIAAAALEILASEGAEAMTLERVAREIGASKGIILHYFATKDALRARVIDDALRVLGQAYRRATGGVQDARQKLETTLNFAASSELYTQSHARVWLALMARPPEDSAARRFRRIISRRLRRQLVIQLRMLIGPMEAGPVADSLMALIDGLWLRRALEPTEVSPETARALLTTHLEESIAFVKG